MASVRHAAFHDARLSMLAARRGIMPGSGNAGVSSWVVHSAVGFSSPGRRTYKRPADMDPAAWPGKLAGKLERPMSEPIGAQSTGPLSTGPIPKGPLKGLRVST